MSGSSIKNWSWPGCRLDDTAQRDRYPEAGAKLHPGKKNNLNALCDRYQIDNSHRTLHGALLDTELLAEVYLAMTRGQDSLLGDETQMARKPAVPSKDASRPRSACCSRAPKSWQRMRNSSPTLTRRAKASLLVEETLTGR